MMMGASRDSPGSAPHPDPKQRFSNRVDYYARYRPGYPIALLEFCTTHLGLAPQSVIADIGSGTGLLSELFLKNGNPVRAVEPNAEMRRMAESLLKAYPNLKSVAASAEATSLPAHSVDFVSAGQAFHWFDPQAARVEFVRILRPSGWVLLVWNQRKDAGSPFMAAYESLLDRFASKVPPVTRSQGRLESLDQFFTSHDLQVFDNVQVFDYHGLLGRLLSSSYAPLEGHPDHAPMVARLAEIFQAHQEGGEVRFEYDTRLYYGRLG
jgi:SAM-dependent methyltransferase